MTPDQGKWLQRIVKQIGRDTIVDISTMDAGNFRRQGGGFSRMNRVFNGRLAEHLSNLQAVVWQSPTNPGGTDNTGEYKAAPS